MPSGGDIDRDLASIADRLKAAQAELERVVQERHAALTRVAELRAERDVPNLDSTPGPGTVTDRGR